MKYPIPPAYGYEWVNDTLVPVPAEAENVKVILKDMQGWGDSEAAKQLNFYKRKTRAGKPFTARDVHRIREKFSAYAGAGYYYGRKYPCIL